MCFWHDPEGLQRQHLHHHILLTFINIENGSWHYANTMLISVYFYLLIVPNKLLISEAESNFIRGFYVSPYCYT